MNPEQYLRLQEAFLELRELDATTRQQRLSELERRDPEIAEEVRGLLQTDENDDSFLEKPVIDRDQRMEIETKDMQPSNADNVEEMPTHIGPYRVLQKIGEGGHGVVFMAEQTQPIRRKVAIKWIKRGMDSDMILARFEAEWQALAMMKHPSIANVIEAKSTESGQPYFVMELVHGIPIDEFCDQNKLNLQERLALFQQVCGAVHHAHQKGIIHRDIKPANVLITTDSGKPLAKVIDFGIAKALHMPLTEKTMFTEYGQIVGTLEYMSPEQALMSQTGIDVRSDVYSLGVLLYLLLTGETPVSRKELLRDGIWELKNVLQSTQPQTPSTRITSRTDPQRWRDHAVSDAGWVRSVSGDLDWITMKAIAREPEFRYDSAADFSSDIDRYLQGDAIEARPPSRWYKFQKFVRRNRIAVGASVVVAASVLASLIAISLGYASSLQNLKDLRIANEGKIEALTKLQAALDKSQEYSMALSRTVRQQKMETAWDSALMGDVSSASTLLDEIPEDIRGNAWKFCQTLADQYRLPVFRSGFEPAIRTMAVDESANRIAIVNSASEVEIWDAASLELVHTIKLPTAIYTSACFSNKDTLLVGGPGNALAHIDLQTWNCNRSTGLRVGAVRAIDYDSTKECWWLTTGGNAVIQLNEPDLKQLARDQLPERIRCIAVSEDGSQLAVGTLKGNIFILDAGNLASSRKVSGRSSAIEEVRFMGSELVAIDASGNVLTANVESSGSKKANRMSLVSKTSGPPVANTLGTEFAAFSALRDNSVWLLEDKNRLPLRMFPGAVRKLAWLNSVERLFAVHADGRISVFDRREISRRKHLAALPEKVVDGDANPELNLVVTSHLDGNIKTWNSSTGSMMASKKLHSAEPLELEINHAGTMLASYALDRTMVICELPEMNVVHRVSIGWGVRSPSFSPDGKLVAGPAASDNPDGLVEGTIDIWDVTSGKAIQRLVGHQNWILALQFIDQNELISLSVDGTVKIWSVQNGQCLVTINFAEIGNASCLAIDKSNGHILLGHSDGVVSVWDRSTGELVRSTVAGSSPVIGLTFVDNDHSVLVVAVENDPSLLLLDSGLKTTARLNSGVGPLLAFRSQPKAILVIGRQGFSKIIELTHSENHLR